MYRGTTPTLRFEIEDVAGQKIPTSLISVLYITFSQDQTIKLERNNAVFEGNMAMITLTQQETLALSSGIGRYPIQVQLRGKLKDGNVFASQKMIFDVEEVLKDGVI